MGRMGHFALFAVLKGLHMAIFAALAGLLMPRTWAIPAVAALWTGLERTHGPLGFAWLELGNAGIDMPVADARRTISPASTAYRSCLPCSDARSRW